MNARTVIRHILGYLFGFSVFLLGIPLGLGLLAKLTDGLVFVGIIPDERVRLILALVIGLVGVAFALWSNLYLFLVGRGGPADAFGVALSPRSQNLVTSGPYRWTRNPMAFGALSIYLAVALYLDSAACLAVVAVLWVAAPIYLKRVEEKRLLADFGDAFVQYRRTVPMLIPLPHRRVV